MPFRIYARPRQGSPPGWARWSWPWRPPLEPAAPGAYDFARRAYFQGLGGVGFAYGKLRAAEPSPDGLEEGQTTTAIPLLSRIWWTRLRLVTSERILAALPGEPGAVAAALMTGARGAIPGRRSARKVEWLRRATKPI